MGEVTADITGNILPTHYKAVLTLTDANGKQLCDSFTSMKYTTAQEKFDAQTVDDFKDETVIKSARNIPGVETAMAGLINVYDILKAKYLVLDKGALAVIQEVFA